MIKWGILGLGNAASSFAEAIKEVENAKLISIASLSKTKLKSFGKKFNIVENYRFNTYQDLINNPIVDTNNFTFHIFDISFVKRIWSKFFNN
jgi:predicted dehydrogenase